MFTISKNFEFAASHRLNLLPDAHKCSNLHGHNYLVVPELQAPALDSLGFVLDFGKMKPFSEYIDKNFDHHDLNEVMGEVHPTAENIAYWLYSVAAGMFNDGRVRVSSVTVWETGKSRAVYSE